jgi:hypothetical protein
MAKKWGVRMRSLLFKKIHCLNCGSTFKSKLERGKRVYVCSRYNGTKGECKKRVIIHEDKIINLVKERYHVKLGQELTREEIGNKVEKIEIEDKLLFRIKLSDFRDNDIIFERNRLIF